MSDTYRFGCVANGDDLLGTAQALRAAVGEHLVERERTPGGLRLRVGRDPQAVTALHDYVRREQACCSFFDIVVAEDAETLSVTVTGPPEASVLIDLLYQLTAPTTASAPYSSDRSSIRFPGDPGGAAAGGVPGSS